MKILAMVAMAAVAGTASARNIEVPTGSRVTVCMETMNAKGWVSLMTAKGLASKMFADAGVAIDWRSFSSCPADGIRVSFSLHTPESEHRGAFAYAMPVEGVHIVLFWDRIASTADSRVFPILIAHVLVHEVTHILQGVCRHSDTGVMKAVFTAADIAEMASRPLPFTDYDLELIHDGIKAREGRLSIASAGR